MEHTPGNWRIQNASDTYNRYQIEANGWGIILRCEDTSNESQANARLIAAAPELLEALRSLYYAVSDEEDDYPDSQLYHIVMNATKRAQAAIDKATG